MLVKGAPGNIHTAYQSKHEMNLKLHLLRLTLSKIKEMQIRKRVETTSMEYDSINYFCFFIKISNNLQITYMNVVAAHHLNSFVQIRFPNTIKSRINDQWPLLWTRYSETCL